MKTAGFEVNPVNPKAEEILGARCYTDIKELPKKSHVVNFVVPPKVIQKILETCLTLGATKAGLQPGSESEKAVDFCEDNEIKDVHGVCVIVQRRKRAA